MNSTDLRKAWLLLEPRQRRGAVVLLFFMAIGAVLETIGVGLAIPVIVLLAGGGSQFPMPTAMRDWLAAQDRSLVVIAGVSVLLLAYLLKAIYRLGLVWQQNRFAFGVQCSLSSRLFASYLRRPWSFHLQHNSAALVQSVMTEVDQFAFGVVVYSLGFVSEAFVVCALGALLLAIEPVGGLVVIFVLAVIAYGFHRITDAKADGLANGRRKLDRQRLQVLQQGFGGVKEALLLKRECEFIRQFSAASEQSARIGRMVQTLRDLPRLWIELLAVAGLTILVVVMVIRGRSAESIVPVIGLFAVAVFRLVPSASRMLTAVHAIGLGLLSVRTLSQELSAENDPVAVVAEQGPAHWGDIQVSGLNFAYASQLAPVLQGVSLTISRGETVGLIGASGSGKSTLVDVLLGLLTPAAGRVLVGGVDIATCRDWWQRQIGYVPQAIYLLDDSLRRNVAFGIAEEHINDESVSRAITLAHLDDFVASLPKGLATVVGERGVRISGGQRQRIGIARALYHNPEVLVLDEATSALDGDTEETVMEAIDALHGRKTIVVIAHRTATVTRCDRVLRIDGGMVREDVPHRDHSGH
jgi:ABC-type multidrug transport system fused ATPase/permease subunit